MPLQTVKTLIRLLLMSKKECRPRSQGLHCCCLHYCIVKPALDHYGNYFKCPIFRILWVLSKLTLKAPITTAPDDIHKYEFFHCFSETIRLDISHEFSARQRIHMKNQALFFSKDKSKTLECHLLQCLFGALRVKDNYWV